VSVIHADLTAMEGTTLNTAQRLAENAGVSFMGVTKSGPFDISERIALELLCSPTPHGKPNSNVVRPSINGADLAKRPSGEWIINFGIQSEAAAALYEAPFEYALKHIKNERQQSRTPKNREIWWLFERARPEMFAAFGAQPRYIATCLVAKHRFFVWQNRHVVPENVVIVIARSDDTTFGILHSRFHELWSLRLCTWLGKGNDPRYTPTTTFETFPFPAGLTPADTGPVGAQPCFDPAQHGSGRRLAVSGVERAEAPPAGLAPGVALRHRSGQAEGARLPQIPVLADPARLSHAKAIAQAAFDLNRLREAWLNPPVWVDWVITPEEEQAGFPRRPVAKPGHEANLKQRTLTNLYNTRPAWLAMAHERLDQAVAAAYGWDDYTPDMADEDILRRLLALNRARSGR